MVTLEKVYRIKVFVPSDFVDRVIESILNIVSLQYGNYDSVLWRSAEGIEQFRPLSGANPTSGKSNCLEENPSIKIEFSIPLDERLLYRLIEDGISPVHPWEEPVILISEEMETRQKF
jgi:hypothetical protein